MTMSSVHADFETVLDFIPSCIICEDIWETIWGWKKITFTYWKKWPPFEIIEIDFSSSNVMSQNVSIILCFHHHSFWWAEFQRVSNIYHINKNNIYTFIIFEYSQINWTFECELFLSSYFFLNILVSIVAIN